MNWLKKLFTSEYKLPHEQFPKLVFWEIGDRIDFPRGFDWSHGKFLGTDNRMLYIDVTHIVVKYPMYRFDKLSNCAADKRFYEFDKARITKDISNDNYTEFLKILRQENAKLLGA